MGCSKALAFVMIAGLQAADLAGHYYLRGVREVGSELLLRPDGRFDFALAYGAADYESHGTWRAVDGAVLLNSDPAAAKPLRLIRSAVKKDEGIRVWILAPKGQPVSNVDVLLETVEGTARGSTSRDGSATLVAAKPPKAVRIEIPVYQFQSELIPVNPAHGEFWFEIDGAAITRMEFKNERLTVEDGALVMRRMGAEHPMRYVRQ